MEYINIETQEQYDQEIASGKIIVLYTADGCDGCEEMRQTLQELDADGRIKVLEVNSDTGAECDDIVKNNGIESVPTVQCYLDGEHMDNLFVEGLDVDRLKESFEALKGM